MLLGSLVSLLTCLFNLFLSNIQLFFDYYAPKLLTSTQNECAPMLVNTCCAYTSFKCVECRILRKVPGTAKQ